LAQIGAPIIRNRKDPTMKVIELRDQFSLNNLTMVERPEPEPGPGQVVLAMRAASLNYRDWLLANGGYGSVAGLLPLIPVSDGVGEVAAVGAGVTRVAVGARVCPIFFQGWIGGEPSQQAFATSLGGPLDGTLAEFMLLDQQGVVKVPAHLSDEAAATLPCAALTAWSSVVTEGGVKAGDTVLVQGTGGVSLFALQFALLQGAQVIATSKSDEKLARVRAMGATHTINYEETPDWGKAAHQWTGGRGVDLVVDVGGAATLPEALRAIRFGGRIAMMGVLTGAVSDLRIAAIVMRQVRLQGITVGPRAGFEAMARAIGQHRMEPAVDRVFPFEEARAAFDYLAEQRHFGKVCIKI
jgi:NADPH:quinone reductase-like Zn-dependent oxidoreductase